MCAVYFTCEPDRCGSQMANIRHVATLPCPTVQHPFRTTIITQVPYFTFRHLFTTNFLNIILLQIPTDVPLIALNYFSLWPNEGLKVLLIFWGPLTEGCFVLLYPRQFSYLCIGCIWQSKQSYKCPAHPRGYKLLNARHTTRSDSKRISVNYTTVPFSPT